MTDSTAKGAAAMQIDADLVQQLAELLDTTQLTEIEVQDGDRRIRVARNVTIAAQQAAYAPAAAPAVQPAQAAAEAPQAAPENHPGAVKSPMVGTAYLAAEPGAPQFVNEGQEVKAGDTVMIVEAMKVMNPITAPRAGRLTRLLIENAQPVEFDQPLFIIE